MTTEPTDDADIATKQYVDDAVSGVSVPDQFTDLTDTPSDYTGQGSKVVKVKSTEDGLEFADESGGASSFLDLTDTPSDYTGQAGKVPAVKSTEDGLEFVSPGTPDSHHTTHEAGGLDAIKLDDLASPDDNTDLNVSTSAHGLCPKLPNNSNQFLNGVGSWAVPSGGGGGSSRNIIIDEPFDGLTTGNIDGQGSYTYASAWDDPAETGYANVIVKSGSDKCLEINPPASTTQNIKTVVSNKFGLTPGFRLSWKMKSSTDASGNSGGLLIADAGGTTRASVRFGYSGAWKLRFYNGSTYYLDMNASADTWYQIDMVFQPGASGVGIVLLYIDGVYKGTFSSTQIAASGKGLEELRIYWTSGTTETALYVDDLILEVYHPLEAA